MHKRMLAYAAAGLLIVLYLVRSGMDAVHTPAWLDEVLALWLLRLPGLHAIYNALSQGTQYAPPGHPFLLYEWGRLAGYGLFAMRVPSIVGILVAGLAMFVLVRRYFGESVALMALSFTLAWPLYGFALQIRPYAITVGAYALAVVLWDDLERRGERPLRLLGIFLLLGFAIAFHFYCVLYLVSFGIMELLQALCSRRMRWRVWLTLVASGLTIVPWLPLAHRISRFSEADKGPFFYATPTLQRFNDSRQLLLSPSLLTRSHVSLLLAFLAIVVLVRRRDLWDTAAPERIVQARPLLIAALGSLSLPFVAYAFGANITGVYNSRYALPGTLGVILLMCCAVEFFPWKAVTVPLAALALGLEGFQLEQTPVPFPRFEHAFEHMPGTAPVVFAEGLYFFQAKEEQALTQEQRARIVYLTMPQGWRFGDPTNENLALRSLSMFPELPVYPAETYLHGRQCFFVYDTHFSSDDLSYFLGQAALVPVTTDVVDGATVQRFCPKGAEPQR